MSNSELERHYLDTTYSIFINEEQYDINIEKPLPPVIKKLVNKEKSAVILTAWNPRSQSLSSQENKERNSKLKIQLKNFIIFNALGQGSDLSDTSWPAEESYFVLGIKKREAELLAVEYEQYAYVWLESEKPASLIFTHIWQSLRTE